MTEEEIRKDVEEAEKKNNHNIMNTGCSFGGI